jgi:DNA helicase-2/ATP-dependent DNA helicase PcrA
MNNDERIISGEGLSVCVTQIIKNSGIAEYHVSKDEVMGNQRLNNLQELVNAASLYPRTAEGLLEFLEHIELDRSLEGASLGGHSSQDGKTANEENNVTLITFHNTKGLEFRKVIMTGLEQGVFPREDKRKEELEEERRLFYVGATRAMDELYLCSCSMRRMYGRTMPSEPSLFLREIDKSCLKTIGVIPRGFSAQTYAWNKDAATFGNGVQTAKKYVSAEAEEARSLWQRGQRLFHDDHGYGTVVEVRDSDEGPVVRVQFDTGKEARFLSEHQGSAYAKINDDD